ncbi:MAG: acyltransferase [Pseudomonadota bacterium]
MIAGQDLGHRPPTPPPIPEPPPTAPKRLDIQCLRALAASTVALLHLIYAFANNLGEPLLPGFDSARASQGAVMLFFVISGYVMILSSARLFGEKRARRVFWTRRLVRILPPYWIATGALALVFLTVMPRAIDGERFALSLALIPHLAGQSDPGNPYRSLPFLWPGWTLFYEFVFYFLLGALMTWGRRAAIVGATLGLIALVVAGLGIEKEAAAEHPIAWTLTRPVLLMFVPGMALRLLHEAGWQAPLFARLLALLAAGLLAALVPEPQFPSAMGFDYLAWCGVPAILIAFAAIGGPVCAPNAGAASRLIAGLGDMSYALYLLHVPIAWAWLWFCIKLPFFTPGPLDYFLTASLVAFALSWLFYVWVERPMTRALNRRLAAQA